MTTRRIELGGLGFHVVDEGEGDPVVLLHGFPDTSNLWRHQIPVLVENGFRAIAPDLRGRGDSDIAERVEDYAMPLLIQDVTGIIDALGIDRASVVGHDWGAGLAWSLTAFVPERVERLVAVSVGHPTAFSRRNVEQLARSWYMWIFQFEGVAEELFSKDDWKIFREWVGKHGDADEYIEYLAKPGRFTAGLNWYRANIRPESLPSPSLQFPPITCPVLGIWSDKDFALSERQMTESAEFVEGPWRYEKIEGVGHWIPLQAPDEFNQLLLGFLRQEF